MVSFSMSWRPVLAIGLATVALAAVIVVLVENSGSTVANANSVSAAAAYPALGSSDSSGITLLAASHAYRSGDPTGPSFPANPPGELAADEHWPIANTIRRLSVSVPGVRAWIAESYGGGVCVLAWDGGTVNNVSAVGFSCSTAATLDRGVGVELRDIPSMPGKVLKVGVAPSGTVAMTTKLADGSTMTTPVSGNAWAYMTDEGSVIPDTTTASRG